MLVESDEEKADNGVRLMLKKAEGGVDEKSRPLYDSGRGAEKSKEEQERRSFCRR